MIKVSEKHRKPFLQRIWGCVHMFAFILVYIKYAVPQIYAAGAKGHSNIFSGTWNIAAEPQHINITLGTHFYVVEPAPAGSHMTTQLPLRALLRPARGPPSASSACTSAASLNLLLLLLAPAPPAPASSSALM